MKGPSSELSSANTPGQQGNELQAPGGDVGWYPTVSTATTLVPATRLASGDEYQTPHWSPTSYSGSRYGLLLPLIAKVIKGRPSWHIRSGSYISCCSVSPPSLPGHCPPATLQLGDFCAPPGDQLILVCPGHADVASEASSSREPTGFQANPDGSSSDLPVN